MNVNQDFITYGEYNHTFEINNKTVDIEILKQGLVVFIDFTTYVDGVMVCNTTTGNNFSYKEIVAIFSAIKAEMDAISGGKPVVFGFEATCPKRHALYKKFVTKVGGRLMPSGKVVKFVYCSKA